MRGLTARDRSCPAVLGYGGPYGARKPGVAMKRAQRGADRATLTPDQGYDAVEFCVWLLYTKGEDGYTSQRAFHGSTTYESRRLA